MRTLSETAPVMHTNHPGSLASDLDAPSRVAPRRSAASKITAEVFTTLLRHSAGVIVQDDSGAVRALARLTEEQADDPQLVVLLDHYAANDYLAEAGGKIPAAARQATSDLQAQGDLL